MTTWRRKRRKWTSWTNCSKRLTVTSRRVGFKSGVKGEGNVATSVKPLLAIAPTCELHGIGEVQNDVQVANDSYHKYRQDEHPKATARRDGEHAPFSTILFICSESNLEAPRLCGMILHLSEVTPKNKGDDFCFRASRELFSVETRRPVASSWMTSQVRSIG